MSSREPRRWPLKPPPRPARHGSPPRGGESAAARPALLARPPARLSARLPVRPPVRQCSCRLPSLTWAPSQPWLDCPMPNTWAAWLPLSPLPVSSFSIRGHASLQLLFLAFQIQLFLLFFFFF